MSKETEVQNFARIVENMITEEFGLSIETRTLLVFDALSNYLSQHPFNFGTYWAKDLPDFWASLN